MGKLAEGLVFLGIALELQVGFCPDIVVHIHLGWLSHPVGAVVFFLAIGGIGQAEAGDKDQRATGKLGQ
ncbi:hypothetical protein [Thiolapillus sp.]|uniref:hypothetical protein n=1 Tax=Thiolapillus sp. TaxID=2017437 RepID=UPI003AF9B940